MCAEGGEEQNVLRGRQIAVTTQTGERRPSRAALCLSSSSVERSRFSEKQLSHVVVKTKQHMPDRAIRLSPWRSPSVLAQIVRYHVGESVTWNINESESREL